MLSYLINKASSKGSKKKQSTLGAFLVCTEPENKPKVEKLLQRKCEDDAVCPTKRQSDGKKAKRGSRFVLSQLDTENPALIQQNDDEVKKKRGLLMQW